MGWAKTGAGIANSEPTSKGVAHVSASKTKVLFCGLGFLMAAVTPFTAMAADDVFIAGVAPDRRPESAPKVMGTVHPQAWYVQAVRGVVPPYPQSLFFLDNQGEWYTPFTRPGMPGPYDIRGWFAKK